MKIWFSIPDEMARRMIDRWGDLPQRALEALVVKACRDGVMTSREVQEVLGLKSRHETDAFLKNAGIYLEYSIDDLDEDVRVLREVLRN